MTPVALMALNNLTLPANLLIGQVLQLKALDGQLAAPAVPARAISPGNRGNAVIYAPKTAATPAPVVPVAAATLQHTVMKGETLFSISRLYKVKAADLQAWNGKLDGNVKIGEVLQVTPNTK